MEKRRKIPAAGQEGLSGKDVRLGFGPLYCVVVYPYFLFRHIYGSGN